MEDHQVSAQDSATQPAWAIAVHGGAGSNPDKWAEDKVVARKAGVQIGPLYISLPTCDRFLGCELEFQRGSELAEAFNRYKEIEEQGALEDLYRKRLEAMRVKRKRRDEGGTLGSSSQLHPREARPGGRDARVHSSA